jgi:hypothetical protein
VDSIKKNTVAATIAMEMIQKEMATGSLGSRNPFKSGFAAEAVIAERLSTSTDNADILEVAWEMLD